MKRRRERVESAHAGVARVPPRGHVPEGADRPLGRGPRAALRARQRDRRAHERASDRGAHRPEHGRADSRGRGRRRSSRRADPRDRRGDPRPRALHPRPARPEPSGVVPRQRLPREEPERRDRRRRHRRGRHHRAKAGGRGAPPERDPLPPARGERPGRVLARSDRSAEGDLREPGLRAHLGPAPRDPPRGPARLLRCGPPRRPGGADPGPVAPPRPGFRPRVPHRAAGRLDPLGTRSCVPRARRARRPAACGRYHHGRHRAQAPRGAAPPGAEDGEPRAPRRRHGPRLQQPDDGGARPRVVRRREPAGRPRGARRDGGDRAGRAARRRADSPAARLRAAPGRGAAHRGRERVGREPRRTAAAADRRGRRARHGARAGAALRAHRPEPARAGAGEPRGERPRRDAGGRPARARAPPA